MIRPVAQAGAAIALGALVWLAAPAALTAQDDDTAAGRQLYLTGCVSCHGDAGQGTAQGPPLIGVGAAAADFMLRTGRMPLDEPGHQAIRKEPAYDDEQIGQLVAYVASLGAGPEIPQVDPDTGDLAVGGEIFRQNCAACHQAAGSGGALSSGEIAPDLYQATATEVGEAVRIGPGEMPVFGPDVIADDQLSSLARYVLQLDDPESPGGLQLPTGPVAEGFVALLVGLGGLMLVARWVTATRDEREGAAAGPGDPP
jgi:ubiquinol-cytochrome c reductase cytochrome c subunit